jgi:uncharacterized protein with ParB-like and HNH nuclease domain
LGDENKKIEDIEPYFLGCIVLIKGKSRDAEVVDGQQRLTTLTILLAALRVSIPNKIAEHNGAGKCHAERNAMERSISEILHCAIVPLRMT